MYQATLGRYLSVCNLGRREKDSERQASHKRVRLFYCRMGRAVGWTAGKGPGRLSDNYGCARNARKIPAELTSAN